MGAETSISVILAPTWKQVGGLRIKILRTSVSIYGYTRIFTDGSKIGEAVGSAAIVASKLSKKRLLNNSSIRDDFFLCTLCLNWFRKSPHVQ